MDSAEDRTEQATPSPQVAPLPAGESTPDPVIAGPDPGGEPPRLAKWLAIYTLLRVGMLALLAGLLVLLMPLILALLFAVLLALPLSWLLFGGVRRRVNDALANANAPRRAERDRLRSALNGDERR